MAKPKKSQPQPNRFWKKLKKRPKTTIVIIALLVLVIGFAASQEIQQQTQAHKLRVADETLQKFADEIEKYSPNISFSREKYCRHYEQKLSSGPLVCESELVFNAKFNNQVDLNDTLISLSALVSGQDVLEKMEMPGNYEVSKYETKDGALITASLTYSNLTDESLASRGEFSFSVGASEKVHRPIYNYRD